MKKSFIILLHCAYWLMYLLLLAVIFAAVALQFKKSPSPVGISLLSPLMLLYILPNLISFYAFYFLLFPRFLRRKKFAALIIFGVCACLLAALSGSLFSIIPFGLNQPIFNDAGEFLSLTIPLFLIAAVHGIIALLIRGFITWFDEIKLKEELADKNHEMELALIKSQLNPHFLFNTINNIDVLITKDATRASKYLNKLSGILRYLLYEAKTGQIALAEELGYIEKYLELQRIRTTNQNYVNFKVTGEPHNLKIAPMIFFPFIENAFKHTENNKNANEINIEISIETDRVKFVCKNTYQNNSSVKNEFGGLGNELIGRRLMLLYPNKHSLETGDYDGIYKVKLSLDLV
jgi:two-component system, LytTR family, sensor kinase